MGEFAQGGRCQTSGEMADAAQMVVQQMRLPVRTWLGGMCPVVISGFRRCIHGRHGSSSLASVDALESLLRRRVDESQENRIATSRLADELRWADPNGMGQQGA